MSCDITRGRRDLLCKDNQSGIKNAFVINNTGEDDLFTISGSEVTAISNSITEVFKFELRNDTNAFTENKGEDGRESGVTMFEQSVVLALKKIDLETTETVNVLAKSRPYIVVQDRNNNWRLAGLSEGMDCTAEITSGAARTDFSGYTLTFVAMEPELAPHLDSATVTALEALAIIDPPSV